ncbi:enkurin domain-containing protein 1 [Ornithorhynchus anatinus]|uniref:Enkurin domain containing 1 n=1 Tax=Ornithorhynchus anatinus TaxID=9258 RepID=F7DEN3_ORNAN|nr:enkurin domain-containing protein 1 [Ornithorhynchus anatinus]XP_028905652.1 enkurin domain-containing protein 1 [Ornithorhynchus anatinus]
MCEGPSRISGPIPPDPSLFPDYYRRPSSARGRLEGHALKLKLPPTQLAPDPALSPPCRSARPAQPAPSIRPKGQELLEPRQRGVAGLLLQLEGFSLGQDTPPKRKEPKDHEKENRRRLREIQRRHKEQEQSRSKPVKALWHSSKYDKVESRVKAKLQEPSPSPSPLRPFLRAYSRCGPGVQPLRAPSPGPAHPNPDVEEFPAPKSNVKPQGPVVDFISHNARTAQQAPLRRSRSLQALAGVLARQQQGQEKYNAKQKGQVPHYLLERKALWQRELEERQRNLPDPATPPGHTMMLESQRLETLGTLQQRQTQLLRELVLLPARADSLRAQNHRAELEKKLSQLEEAIKIFSRPKVFIKQDS